MSSLITEQGDLGLGVSPLSTQDQAAFDQQKLRESQAATTTKETDTEK